MDGEHPRKLIYELAVRWGVDHRTIGTWFSENYEMFVTHHVTKQIIAEYNKTNNDPPIAKKKDVAKKKPEKKEVKNENQAPKKVEQPITASDPAPNQSDVKPAPRPLIQIERPKIRLT